MYKKQLLAILLTLSAPFSSASARADLTGTTTAAQEQRGSPQDDEDLNRSLLTRFRAAKLSLSAAIEIAEHLHPGSRTASISFEPAASPGYRVLTVKHAETWENIIDANTGSIVRPETTLSLSELDDEDRSKIVAFRSVRQELSDAVRVAEKAASGKALGGGLVREDGKLNFVVVVASGDSLKEVMLEPPKAGRRGSDNYRLSQPQFTH
ncbi:MAG: PepSY domain-containing protein [Bradyrhizobium sp.]|uniref:PepSY domain-containing protein n=1 Tax=Bradyrhizobium sp. TaxID=376 RepID=UPI0025BA483F|nr:PepSY domain-containing protein [Bradyrhizobium sp.]MBI5264030.1 PepSY domain-containing protein [Bradyrhizobium sp.]